MAGEWLETNLDDLIEIKHGFAFKGEYFRDEPHGDILLTPGNFAIGGGFKDDKFKYYDGPVLNEFVLTKGDLLVTMTDLSKDADTLGYTAFVPDAPSGRRFLHNQRLGKIILKKKSVNLHYLHYLMSSREYRHEVVSSATGTTVKHTSPERIKRFHFKLPSFPEQQAIAHILGTLDDKIELNRKMNKTLEDMARAIFKSWFVDFDPVHAKAAVRREHPDWSNAQVSRAALPNLNPEIAELFPDSFEDSELGKIPQGWRIGKFGDCCNVKGGYAYKSKNFTDEGYPLARIKNITPEKTVDLFDVVYIPEDIALQTRSFWLTDGDLLMAMTGATIGKFGLIVNRKEMSPAVLNQRVAKNCTKNVAAN